MWYCDIHNSTFITSLIFCPNKLYFCPIKTEQNAPLPVQQRGFSPQHEVYFPLSFSLQHHGCKHVYVCTYSALLIQILNANVYMYIICISFLLLLYTNEMKTNLLTTVVPFSSGLACDEWCLRPSNLPKLVERCEEDSKTKRYGGHCHHLVREV